MNSKWLEAVESVVTELDQQQILLFDLSMFAIVDVTGNDAETFLQGQFCNDLSSVSQTHAQITGYCTPKGRLLALPLIVGIDNGFRLLLPSDVAQPFLKRLSMFVMRSAVVITERSDCVCVGLGDSEQQTVQQNIAQSLPEGVMSALADSSSQLIQCHHDLTTSRPRARYLRIAAVEDQILFWNRCSSMPRRNGLSWRAADISAGVPSIRAGTVESFVPQMLNLQLIDGLSFTKGCYPGQEIVARMQYLGKLKRHMRLFSLETEDANALPAPGATLSTDADADAGVLVDAQMTDDGRTLLLAVVKVSANSAVLRIADRQLSNENLPYELPTLLESDVQSDAKSDAQSKPGS